MSIIIKEITPVVNYAVRKLCLHPYPGRPHGCPNYGLKKRCPPNAILFEDFFDMKKPFYAIINVFDLRSHVERMKQRHPNWSEKQLRNCLYWQKTARKALKRAIFEFYKDNKEYRISVCPEGMGVNVFSTLNKIGIHMEWPPKDIAYQVAIAGIRKKHIKYDEINYEFN